jgi:Xaa-Pro aminopeptidase
LERVKSLQKELNKKSIQSILITSKPNLRYFSNFEGSKGYLLVTKKRAIFLTDFRYTEAASKCVPKGMEVVDIGRKMVNWEKVLSKYKIKEIGIEDDVTTLLQYKSLRKVSKGVKFKKTYPLLLKIREKKSQEEIKILTKSQALNEKVLDTVIKKFVRPGVTEKDTAWEIEKTARELGAEKLAFPPIIAFGKNSSMPHAQPGNKRLKKGDVILIDMGIVYKGYHSDISRTFFTAKPTALQKKIYNIVLKAQEKAIAGLKPGITGEKVDKIARKVIEDEGYGETFGHACGHGVGFQIHELPSFSDGYKTRSAENAVVTIEPGIYLEGKFGVRIEDMVVITEKGPKNITKLSKKLSHTQLCF